MLDRGYVVSSVAAITSVQAEEIPSFGKTLAQMDFSWNNLSPTNSKIVASTTGHNIFYPCKLAVIGSNLVLSATMNHVKNSPVVEKKVVATSMIVIGTTFDTVRIYFSPNNVRNTSLADVPANVKASVLQAGTRSSNDTKKRQLRPRSLHLVLHQLAYVPP